MGGAKAKGERGSFNYRYTLSVTTSAELEGGYAVVKVDSKSRGVPFQGRLTSPGPFPLGITTI